MSPRVLLLSSIYDFSVDLVARRMEIAGVPFVRLNREQFSDLRLSLDPFGPVLRISGLGLDVVIDDRLSSIWYRCPVFIRNIGAKILSPIEQLERTQWSAFLRGLMVFDKARWMNHPADTYFAESKPVQLKLAKEIGFAVPHTLVSNDRDAIAREFPDTLAIKSMDTAYLREGDDVLFAYTSIIHSSSLTDAALNKSPVAAQHLITEKTDIRVTVVDGHVFAYRILVGGHPTEGDWRLHKKENISYEWIELPEVVAERCVALCRHLKLPFGAIDLALSNGIYFFIEINPTGEWAWLPDADRTAGAAIVDWLVMPKSSSLAGDGRS